MTKLSIFKKLLVVSAITATIVTGANAAAKENKYIIATASTGGTYYPVGVGIATIASIKLAKKNTITQLFLVVFVFLTFITFSCILNAMLNL